MLARSTRPEHLQARARWATRGVWAAALAVAVAAAAATAHGLYEVVAASGAPAIIAGLYPLITDGLALVAYSATAKLSGHGRGYAWTIVVLAAGLSGLAQAAYLAGGVHTAPDWLRAGVGAWPAIAAAMVAHLLYLLATDRRPDEPSSPAEGLTGESVDERPELVNVGHPLDGVDSASNGHPNGPGVGVGRPEWTAGQLVRTDRTNEFTPDPDAPSTLDRPDTELGLLPASTPCVRPVQPSNGMDVGRPGVPERPNGHDLRLDDPAGRVDTAEPVSNGANGQRPEQSAKDRAVQAAIDYEAEHAEFPTVNQLAQIAEVARGTAGNALKQLREQQDTETDGSKIEEPNHS